MFGKNGIENCGRNKNDIEIYFTEYFPSNKIFTEPGFALVDDFIWD